MVAGKVITQINMTATELASNPGSAAPAGALPEWIPVYPGTAPRSPVSQKRGGMTQYTFDFATSDPLDKVFQYYQTKMMALGLRCLDCDWKLGAYAKITMQSNQDGRYFEMRTEPRDKNPSKSYFVRMMDSAGRR